MRRMLYDWLVSKGQDPIVIEAADLLANPVQASINQFRCSRDGRANADAFRWKRVGYEQLLRELRGRLHLCDVLMGRR